ncbi:S-adenosyl-L-methionine-dependent methyltransferase [Zopfia rhizophila CBS 207.26]|uniref:S-adenosyl-L-methionine-dependent methyltransferase n=1 Tax=Zopfia rhizophila CBS 207.26 TaxID=1314779 RepID=A0A6A6DKY7_9PEZI|nr:S-adenosyl-L-methionine-dependent methyltransferase [Zopfia rhizophila CBS 207.26]
MEAITRQFQDLYANLDDEGRRKLHVELRDLQTSVDTDWDMVARLGCGPMQVAMAKIGADLHIFEYLTASEKPLSHSQLAEQTGAAPVLLGHILRAQAAFGQLQETGKNEYTANRMTRALANPNVLGAITHTFDVNDVVTQAFNTKLTPFEWLQEHPDHMKSLGHAMAIQRSSHWIDSYPVEKEVGNFSAQPDKVILVDVGGGFGQQAIAFKTKFSHLPGRVIVQDIPATLDKAKPAEGIEFMVQDFFQPQAVKGAKFYYVRHVLHDWTDDDCVKILKAIVPAMEPDSRIVVDEVVVPDVGVPWQVAYMDMTMISSLGGIERTRTEWENLMDRAGLKIVEVHKYDYKMQSAILAIPK